jgi:hypothetical protein
MQAEAEKDMQAEAQIDMTRRGVAPQSYDPRLAEVGATWRCVRLPLMHGSPQCLGQWEMKRPRDNARGLHNECGLVTEVAAVVLVGPTCNGNQ